jgi:hypothetical protein
LFSVRRPQGFRRPSMPPLLASRCEKVTYEDIEAQNFAVKKGRLIASLFCTREFDLLHADFDLARLGFFHFRYPHFEDTVLVARFDAILLYRLRQAE